MQKVALSLTRHCMVCSSVYGCKDINETRECKHCDHEPAYCGSDWQDQTTGICNQCFAQRKDDVVRRVQTA